MPWSTLLRQKSIFDDKNISSIVAGLQEAIDMLNLHISSDDRGKGEQQGQDLKSSIQGLIGGLHSVWIKILGDRFNTSLLAQAIGDVEELEQILNTNPKLAHLFGWNATVKSLSKDLLHLQNAKIADIKALQRVTQAIIRLIDTINFVSALEQMDTTLSNFRGTVHCQVSLANYIYTLDSRQQVGYIYFDLALFSNSHILE